MPYVEPSGESSGNMFIFPVSKYTAAFEDKPDGVPVIATFLSSETDSGIDVDDMKRRLGSTGDLYDEEEFCIFINTAFYCFHDNRMY